MLRLDGIRFTYDFMQLADVRMVDLSQDANLTDHVRKLINKFRSKLAISSNCSRKFSSTAQ